MWRRREQESLSRIKQHSLARASMPHRRITTSTLLLQYLIETLTKHRAPFVTNCNVHGVCEILKVTTLDYDVLLESGNTLQWALSHETICSNADFWAS